MWHIKNVFLQKWECVRGISLFLSVANESVSKIIRKLWVTKRHRMICQMSFAEIIQHFCWPQTSLHFMSSRNGILSVSRLKCDQVRWIFLYFSNFWHAWVTDTFKRLPACMCVLYFCVSTHQISGQLWTLLCWMLHMLSVNWHQICEMVWPCVS